MNSISTHLHYAEEKTTSETVKSCAEDFSFGKRLRLFRHPSPVNVVDDVWHKFETAGSELPISVIQAQLDSLPTRVAESSVQICRCFSYQKSNLLRMEGTRRRGRSPIRWLDDVEKDPNRHGPMEGRHD
ncbi:hypothetical protein TNCV_4519511 [Trichonephila clavipes]|nr:hypothetical protein TNCV_4519511 [Trichonephila clavipes]